MDVRQIIMSLAQKPTNGVDQIPFNIVRNTENIFDESLQMVFDLSLRIEVFPTKCKMAWIYPVYKKDGENEIENSRPTAILNTFSKGYEIYLFKQLYSAFASQLSCIQTGLVERSLMWPI